MIARLAIIQRYNANYYYTIQTLPDVYSMNEPYTEFSASLFIVSFEFAGFSRHSLRLYQTKQTNCIIQSSRFGHPPIRLFQFLQRFQSYLFNFENKKAETRRDEKIAQGKWCFTEWSPDCICSGVGVVQVWAWCTPLSAWRGTHSRLAIIQSHNPNHEIKVGLLLNPCMVC